ncbi:histidine phosphatase superfamily [Zalerion maritima]|uniref:Histidine phosphatase superfamily n=1 Tax=Zalerion maritima TaxID=339359 RepID=A0AAD5RK99_9PEZI|nr:histidine phosphatase superfamily [Zalerion maritima]
MASSYLAALSLLAGSASAADIVWSVFAYVHHGERTPLASPNGAALTPPGAVEMENLGGDFKNRFRANTSVHYVQGMSGDALDNTMLDISAYDAQYATGSAQAFMQGLFPPTNLSFAYNDGGSTAASSANGTITDFPLNGYQYPDVYVPSSMTGDEGAVWVNGDVGCTARAIALADAKMDLHEEDDHIQSIFDDVFPDSPFVEALVNSNNAYKLYDYARYEAAHDATVAEELTATELQYLRDIAWAAVFMEHAGLYAGDGDMILAMAGRMLAGAVVDAFDSYYASGGYTHRMNFVFGSFEPLLAFNAITNLTNDNSGLGILGGFPAFGSALVFELYTPSGASASSLLSDDGNFMPEQDLQSDLHVRAAWVEDPSDTRWEELFLFDSSSPSLQWDDFVDKMTTAGISTTKEWCQTCEVTDGFCGGYYLEELVDSGTLGQSGIAPAIAGAIGVVGTILLFLALIATAFFCLGIRLHRPGKDDANKGYRGEERRREDSDVKVGNNGERAAKVGSWELGGGNLKGTSGGSTQATEVSVSSSGNGAAPTGAGGLTIGKWGRRREKEDDEISVLGPQVHARESV